MKDEVKPVVPVDILRVATPMGFHGAPWSKLNSQWVYRCGVKSICRQDGDRNQPTTLGVNAVAERVRFDVNNHRHHRGLDNDLKRPNVADCQIVAVAVSRPGKAALVCDRWWTIWTSSVNRRAPLKKRVCLSEPPVVSEGPQKRIDVDDVSGIEERAGAVIIQVMAKRDHRWSQNEAIATDVVGDDRVLEA